MLLKEKVNTVGGGGVGESKPGSSKVQKVSAPSAGSVWGSAEVEAVWGNAEEDGLSPCTRSATMYLFVLCPCAAHSCQVTEKSNVTHHRDVLL